MSLAINEDEQMLVESVGTMLDASAPVDAFRALRDEACEPRWRRELWDEMVAMELPSVASSGEGGFGWSGAALVMEEIGRRLSASPLASTLVAAEILSSCGREEATAHVLSGEIITALAIEPGPVADAMAADHLIALSNDRDEPVLLWLARDDASVERARLDLVDCRDHGRVSGTGPELDDATVLARGEEAIALARRAADLGALLASAEMLGIARECFERTVAYLKTREQFGVLIGTFQALQHRAARMWIELELAISMVRKAMRAVDAGDVEASDLISHAKWRAGTVAAKVTAEAIQMHGGMGVTDEVDIGLYFKRARVLGELWGDGAVHREQLAVERLGLASA